MHEADPHFLLCPQLSAIQIELKSAKYLSESEQKHLSGNDVTKVDAAIHHARHAISRSHLRRVDERLASLERKIAVVAKKHYLVEKRVVFEDQKFLTSRLAKMESIDRDLADKVDNVGRDLGNMRRLSESMVQLFESMQSLENKIEANQSDTRRELARLDINAARKAAELSLTREELANLKKAVQALSVSASKLQEKSDKQQEVLANVSASLGKLDLDKSMGKAANITKELEHVEDQYRWVEFTIRNDFDV